MFLQFGFIIINYSVKMADFEQILQDNIYLKKNLQLLRHQNEKLQQQLSDQRLTNQQLMDKHTTISENYNALQKKHQMQVAQHSKDISNLNYQIGELKEYIDNKQQQIQEFQLKIIPNLDQDMIRVKLINEMEGPYQEAVEKKEREIARLKERLSQGERKCSLYQLQLETKSKEQKRELDEVKDFYCQENGRILKELNAALAKKEVKSYDQHLFKNQRKQLEELRCTINLQMQNESELRRQVSSLKIDKEKLILQINQMNENKALQIHLSSENEEIRVLKQERKRLEEEILKKTQENQKMDKRFKSLQKQSKKNEDELRNSFIKQRQAWQREKQNYKQDISKHRADLRKSQDQIQRLQEQIQASLQKGRNIQRQLSSKREQNQKLRATVGQLQLSIKHYQLAKKQKLTLSKHFQEQDKKAEEQIKENDRKRTNPIINKQQDRSQGAIAALESANAKLKEKLQRANKKIVQLLKQKANHVNPQVPYSNSRERAFSNVELESLKPRTDKAFLLQYRDASFTPLVPPTIFTQHS